MKLNGTRLDETKTKGQTKQKWNVRKLSIPPRTKVGRNNFESLCEMKL